jgi:hypothetical protein
MATNGQPLTEARKGEISLRVLKYILRKKGFNLAPEKKREFGQLAKDIGVPLPELLQFAKPLAQELLDDLFNLGKEEDKVSHGS